ncbi:MAG: hypothetical protein M4D85_12600, partial [Actinomycetota bacterium]|nr:hypothetical protein [Actinomycetota bacterium]
MTADGGPVRLCSGVGGRRFQSVTAFGGRLFAEVYRDGDGQTVHSVRVLEITGQDEAVDSVPELSGSIHQLITAPSGPRMALWSQDPNFTQHLLVEGLDGWEPMTPELRVAGRCQRLDSGQLVISAYDGIRAGVAVADPQGASWRWLLNDPAASYLPVAARPDGQIVAVRRPADGGAALVSGDGVTTGELLTVPDLSITPAHIRSWDGPAGRLEGLMVSPPGPGPWPLVIDVHGGPNHSLVAGFGHDLHRWRRQGFAALAPEY